MSEPNAEEKPSSVSRRLNPFGYGIAYTAMGVAIGLIELIVFSGAAAAFNVEINLDTMPLNWRVGFYAMLPLPGVCFFWAFAHLFNLFEK